VAGMPRARRGASGDLVGGRVGLWILFQLGKEWRSGDSRGRGFGLSLENMSLAA